MANIVIYVDNLGGSDIDILDGISPKLDGKDEL
jgi:hypothetical protein